MEYPLKRPSWLRWQKGPASLWLDIYIAAAAIPAMLVPILVEQRRLGSDFKTAFLRWLDVIATNGPTTYDYLITAVFVISLGWFTYLSDSPRVKERDKFYVFLMFCGGAIGIGQRVLIHHFTR